MTDQMTSSSNGKFLEKPSMLSQGVYLQLVVQVKFLDDAIIRSNDAEEVLTFKYQPPLNNRFIIPWRKVKGKLRRFVMEKQRGLNIEPSCRLKNDLCMQCPSCFLFGGTGETSNVDVSYNILSRVLGECFISTTEVAEIQPHTQNAVDEVSLMTEQALMTVNTVPKETIFKGVITLRDPTENMAAILVDNLARLSRLGARSVEWGRVRTEIEGCLFSDRESLSAYDMLRDEDDDKKEQLRSVGDLNLPDVEQAYQTLDRKVKGLLEEYGLRK